MPLEVQSLGCALLFSLDFPGVCCTQKDLNSYRVCILKHCRNVHSSSWNIYKIYNFTIFIFKNYEMFTLTESYKYLKSTHIIEIYCTGSIKTQTTLVSSCSVWLTPFVSRAHTDSILSYTFVILCPALTVFCHWYFLHRMYNTILEIVLLKCTVRHFLPYSYAIYRHINFSNC